MIENNTEDEFDIEHESLICKAHENARISRKEWRYLKGRAKKRSEKHGR